MRDLGRAASGAWAWLWLLAACWTGDPPPPQPAPAVLHPRKPPHPAHEQTLEESVDQLQQSLRADAPSVLPQLVDRGVVVLDLDTGAVSTYCDQAALSQVRSWAYLLVDPTRMPLWCQLAPPVGVRCIQGPGPILLLDFQRDGGWRLVGAMIGSAMTLHVQLYQLQLSSASCP